MAVISTPRSFHNRFMFHVEIDGFSQACFHKCSALESETKEITYWPGCTLIPDKSAGKVEFKDIDLERGVSTGDDDMYNWYLTVTNAGANTGGAGASYKRNIEIVQKDRDGTELKRWAIYGAWPKSYRAGEWDASSDEPTIESLKIVYDYYEEIPV